MGELKMENGNCKFCWICFNPIAENEKVAYGVGNDMICCMDCFSLLEPVREDYKDWMDMSDEHSVN